MSSFICRSSTAHSMYVYKSRADRLNAFVELCRCADSMTRYIFFLDSKALELTRYIASSLNVPEVKGAIEFFPLERYYHSNGKTADLLLDRIEESYREALSDGYEGIHVMVDMGFLSTFLSKEEVIGIERRLSEFYRHHSAEGLCVFFYENLPPSAITSLQELHEEIHFSETVLSAFFGSAQGHPALSHSISPDGPLAEMLFFNETVWNELSRRGEVGEHYRYTPLLSLIEQSLWILDESLTVKYVSPSVEQLTGYRAEAFAGREVTDIIPTEWYDYAYSLLKRAEKEAVSSPEQKVRKRFTTVFNDRYSSRRELEHFLYPILLRGKLKGFAGMSRPAEFLDTPSASSAEELVQKWNPIWDSAPVGIVLTDGEGKIRYTNYFFSRLTGITGTSTLPPYSELPCWRNEHIEAPTDAERKGYRSSYIKTASGKTITIYIAELHIGSFSDGELHLLFHLPEYLSSPDELISLLERKERKERGIEVRYTRLREEYGLTEREVQVVRHIMEGLQNKEIGSRLHIEEITVKKHLSHIFRKCDVRSRFELSRFVSTLSEEQDVPR